MRILKRIIYTLLGLIIAGTVALVGVILYAEYSGNPFTPDSIPALAKLESEEDESRLAYDENDNLIELPKPGAGESNADADTAASGETDADTSAESSTGSSASSTSDAPADEETDSSNSAASSGAEGEHPFVMDLSTGIFHTADCPSAAEISAENRSEMTTTAAKVMNAGYKPCPDCHPDTQ